MILNKVLIFLKDIWSNKSLRNFLLLAIAALLFLRQCNQISTLKQDLVQTEETANRNFNNYKAAQDTVRLLELNNGKQAATIKSYEFDIANLEEEQETLISKYRSVLDVNDDLDKVNALLSAEIRIKDSLLASISVEKIDSITDKVTFDRFDDFGNGNTRNLAGSMFVYRNGDNLLYRDAIFSIQQELSLYAAIEDADGDGQDEIKITTDYPGLLIKDIENINLINSKLNQKYSKKAGWSVGLGIGYGINLNNNQVISYGPSLNVGLFWSPKWLRF
jgi:hypothetical protein